MKRRRQSHIHTHTHADRHRQTQTENSAPQSDRTQCNAKGIELSIKRASRANAPTSVARVTGDRPDQTDEAVLLMSSIAFGRAASDTRWPQLRVECADHAWGLRWPLGPMVETTVAFDSHGWRIRLTVTATRRNCGGP